VPRNRKSAVELEEPAEPAGTPSHGAAAMADRIAAFVMLDGMGGASQAQKCVRLSLIGFTNSEIAQMLQTTSGVVASNLYVERKKARPAKARAH